MSGVVSGDPSHLGASKIPRSFIQDSEPLSRFGIFKQNRHVIYASREEGLTRLFSIMTKGDYVMAGTGPQLLAFKSHVAKGNWLVSDVFQGKPLADARKSGRSLIVHNDSEWSLLRKQRDIQPDACASVLNLGTPVNSDILCGAGNRYIIGLEAELSARAAALSRFNKAGTSFYVGPRRCRKACLRIERERSADAAIIEGPFACLAVSVRCDSNEGQQYCQSRSRGNRFMLH